MKFEELNENELFRIKGGEDNSLFYQIGWWLAVLKTLYINKTFKLNIYLIWQPN